MRYNENARALRPGVMTEFPLPGLSFQLSFRLFLIRY